jgi:hypothetical protein
MRNPTKIDSLRLLRERGLNPTTIFDIGAGKIGTHGLFFNFKDKKTILVEPQESYRDSLVKSMENNGVHDYELVFMKAGEKDTKDSITVNKLAADYEPSYLIKVDVDGGDFEVCKGCAEILPETDCVIVEAGLSIHNWGCNRTVASFMEFFKSFGFHLFDIVDCLYYNDGMSNLDLIFISESMRNKLISNTDSWKDNVKNNNVRFDRIINEDNKISKEFSEHIKKLNVAKKLNTDLWDSGRCI